MNLTTEEFKEKIFDFEKETEWNYKGEKAIVLKFSADGWCQPCKAYAPVYEAFAKENTDIDFYSIDVDTQPELAQAFGVKNVPTTVFIPKEGEPAAASGVLPKEKLTEVINEVIKS